MLIAFGAPIEAGGFVGAIEVPVAEGEDIEIAGWAVAIGTFVLFDIHPGDELILFGVEGTMGDLAGLGIECYCSAGGECCDVH